MDGFGCLQMVLGGFRWFSEIYSFNSYGEICCSKFKRCRQLWKVFVVSCKNDAKVPLKQMTKFLGYSKYNVLFKKTLGGYEMFFLSGFDSVSPHFGALFSRISTFALLLVSRSLFQTGDLTNILIYCNLVVIIFSKFQ